VSAIPERKAFKLEVRQLEVMRGDKRILSIEHLAVEEGEILGVIGPNGAGKSTLLLALSGLLTPDRGEIFFQGQPLKPLDDLSYRRNIALVLQKPLLLEGSVYENVAAGLRFRGLGKDEIQRRVNIWLEKMGIAHLVKRRARTLSGGEAQRTSLARAFVLEPAILFLDEPFGALDAPTRQRLIEDLQGVLRSSNTTALFVTHDLDEALLLSTRSAVLLDGQLAQVGTPEEIFNTPANTRVAQFVGVETILPGRITGEEDGLLVIQVGRFHISAAGEQPAGQEVYVCLRPEDIFLSTSLPTSATSVRNRLEGKITKLIPQGPLVRVLLDCGLSLVALITRTSASELGLSAGMQVNASFKASAAHVLPRLPGHTL
jgi:tungstate transport system ATP-binding protein